MFYYSTRTLLQVEDDDKMLVLSCVGQELILNLNGTILSLNIGADTSWKAVTISSFTEELSLSTEMNSNSTNIEPKKLIANLHSVIIGRNFNGFVQDIGVYNSPLQNFNFPTMATFLPQCYCQGNSSLSNDQCLEGTKPTDRQVIIIVSLIWERWSDE